MADPVPAPVPERVQPARVLPGRQAFSGRDDDEVRGDLFAVQRADGSDRLGHDGSDREDLDDRAARRQRLLRVGRLQQAVAAGQHRVTPAVGPEARFHGTCQGLVDRSGAKAQVGREPFVGIQAAANALEQRPDDLSAEDRLE